MAWENPIKTIRLCFYQSGRQLEYSTTKDAYVPGSLIAFLKETDAVIVELENFTDEEKEILHQAKGPQGRSLFASPACAGHTGYRSACARLCPLKNEE
jgi:hypothetical protein